MNYHTNTVGNHSYTRHAILKNRLNSSIKHDSIFLLAITSLIISHEGLDRDLGWVLSVFTQKEMKTSNDLTMPRSDSSTYLYLLYLDVSQWLKDTS